LKVSPDTNATSYIDYRSTRCRCGSVLRPYEPVCIICGRKQNLLFEGLEKMQTDDLEGLISKLYKETANAPYDYIKLFRLGNAHVLRGRFEIARDLYRKILTMKPDFTQARLNLATSMAILGDNDAAVAEFKQFVRNDPHSPKAERAIRAICTIKNIPYEDALKETVIAAPARRPSGLPPKGRIGTGLDGKYGTGAYVRQKPKKASQFWAVFDGMLMLLILLCVAAWFIFPAQSRALLASGLTYIENPFSFEVSSGGDASESNAESQAGPSPSRTPRGPVVLNLNPTTTSYLPLQTGNTWSYVTYDTASLSPNARHQNAGIRTMAVTGPAHEGDEVWSVDNNGDTILYVEKSNGIFTVGDPSSPWSNLILVVPYPAEPGKSVTTRGQTVTIEAQEDITVPAGTFRCVRVKYTLAEPQGLEWTSWYGRGVGLVKYQGLSLDGMYHIFELRDYKLN
jgi:hypothetical protein